MDGTGSATITLLKNCTIDTEFNLTKAVTFDGTSEKYTITLNKDLCVKGIGITVTFKNLSICNTDVKGDKDDSSDSNEILVEAGSIVMENVEFTGAHSVEYGMTLKESAVGGKFTNVNFNDRVLGMNAVSEKVELVKCSNVRINDYAITDFKIGTALDIDKSTAATTTLNFSAGTAITLNLNGGSFQFQNITQRNTAANLTITNGTLENTTFSVYHGDEDDGDGVTANKGYYRSSVVVFGDKLTLAGTTNVKVQQDGFSSLAVPDSKTVTVSGTVTLDDGASIVFGANTKIGGTAGLTVNTWAVGAIDVAKDGGLEIGQNSVTLNDEYTSASFTVPASKNLYVNGKVTFTALTLNGTLVVEKDATVALGQYNNEQAVSTVAKNIVNLGGKVTAEVKESADSSEYKTITVEAKKAAIPVSTVTDLNEALAKGAPVQIGTAGITITENDVITVVPGSSIDGKVSFGSGSATDSVTFKNVTGSFEVAKGNSIDIRNITGITGEIKVESGELGISGKVTGTLTIDANGKIVKFSDVTVNSGAKLILKNNVDGGKFQVVAGKAFNLLGSIDVKDVADGKTLDIEVLKDTAVTPAKTATFKAYSGSQISGKILVKGEGNIDLTQAQNPQSVGEDISYDKTYGQLENVTVVGSLTIKNNSTVTVKGGFQVNEGVTVTIEKGSTLLIDSLAASMIVDGRIIVEEGATLEVKNAKDVKVSGSIDSDGTVVIDSKVTIKSGGAITINDGTVGKATETSAIADVKALYKSTFEPKQGLVVEAGATLTVKSLMFSDAAMNIDNKGTVVFDKAIIGTSASRDVNVTVNMLADGAVVQVISIENIAKAISAEGKATAWQSNSLVIKDLGLVFADKTDVKAGKENTVTITPQGYAFKGLTVVEKITSYTDNAGKKYNNNLDLAGTVSIASVSDTAITTPQDVVSVSGDRIAITGELTLGKYVKLTVTGKVSVTGKLVATEDGSTIDNDGEITVTGLVQVKTNTDIGKINAAMYESKIGTTTVYNYTTLKAAIDSGAKDITVSGKIYVTESVTVPAGVTIKNNGEIVVGSADDTEVVLTVADTASIKYGKVTVDGTLYFENKKDNKAAEIVSDVSVIGEKDARYTNLFTALNNANAGETVTVDKTTVDLKKSITIKEGVTLDVPNSKALKVYAGVTITVNGTLKTAEKIETATFTKTDGTEAQVTFDLAADKLNGKAAIIVNGVFMSGVEFSYNGDAPAYMIPGAYYSLTDDAGAYNYVTTLENASKTAATVVTVYGKVSAGDVVFTGTDSEPKTVTVAAGADLTVASITLDKASFEVKSTGRFTGDVKVGDSAVTVKNVKVEVSIDKNGHMVVETVSKNVTGTETASFKIAAGSIHIREAFMDVTVASGATLASDSEQTILNAKLTIEGTVSVANEQTITVKDDVTVKGALSVADATDSKIAGTFNAEKNLYIGLTPKDVTGDAASVSGAVSKVQVAFVKADANVSDATIESFKVDGVLKSTTYVVEGKDWMTVYDCTNDNSTMISAVNQAPVKNAKFEGKWLNTDGKSANDSKIGASKCDKVTAEITYEIYTIFITPCAGVESIAIDGNLISNYYGDYYNSLPVKAGSHTVTYSLANGYSGEAKLSIAKADKTTASVSGQSFTVSGDEGKVYLQLTGVEKSGYVDPTPVVPEEKDDGMSLTDILLIVLVVLIVIMAVIVAMRLIRS